MTVVTSLDECRRYTYPRDRKFVEAVNGGRFRQLELVHSDTAFIEALELDNRNRQRKQIAYDAGYGRGTQERNRYAVQPSKAELKTKTLNQRRKSAFEPLELLAMTALSVPLYAMVIVAFLAVIK